MCEEKEIRWSEIKRVWPVHGELQVVFGRENSIFLRRVDRDIVCVKNEFPPVILLAEWNQ
jgi:hypothetical protein